MRLKKKVENFVIKLVIITSKKVIKKYEWLLVKTFLFDFNINHIFLNSLF